ncbi:MAG: hypothetical protein A2091_12400 [Desulfuromonadales bacterium GWD2_61_12]|nr:MAG: hypothetical protein A2005_10430 [Desulfuromonadales bacterium GWC2_61_20]OGR35861.1 MAG: hypothetical protein A2091_12400 [Desulfuromonadales bacterium GWD2_61_12]HBT82567.1 hypothetical protein [Desulfuromonas sp.]
MAFDTIDDAFHYVSNAPPGERRAVVHRGSGRVYLASVKADFDERPAGSESDPAYLNIPHRQELDPGKPLLLEFVRSHCPGELPRIEGLFARPGAYRNVKDHFRRLGLLESWQVFEGEKISERLRQWCIAQGLML